MLKVIVIVVLLFWLARRLVRLVPRVEVRVDGSDGRDGDDVRVFAIMREHFPREYEAYKHGLLSESEERRVYLDCVEILGARREIEQL